MSASLFDALIASAKNYPDKIAFKCLNKTLTYSQLLSRSSQVADFLKKEGLQHGDRVGVSLAPSVETAIAVYGILGAGCVFVPLNPALPSNRIKLQLLNCGINTAFVDEGSSELFGDIGIENFKLVGHSKSGGHTSWEEVFEFNDILPEKLPEENDNAYIIYTSGTTGDPKGILHTHRSGSAYARLSAKQYSLSEDDVVGNHSPLHFDISTFGYLTSVRAGATTVIVTDAVKKMPASLSSLIEKEKVTIWYSVPLVLRQLLLFGALQKRDFSDIRWILLGGEPPSTKVLKEVLSCFPNARVSNVYGPAEVNQCTYFDFANVDEIDGPIPLGKAWEEARIHLLDDDEVLEGRGLGELAVATPTMMSGYWNKDSDSAFLEIDGERFYRTGDHVSRDEDGLLTFVGRNDRQIKLHGYRIELGDIDNVLVGLEGVSEAATCLIKFRTLKLIAALVVCDSEFNERNIRLALKKSLPTYVYIDKIFETKNLPRTNAGKTDFKSVAHQIEERYLSEE